MRDVRFEPHSDTQGTPPGTPYREGDVRFDPHSEPQAPSPSAPRGAEATEWSLRYPERKPLPWTKITPHSGATIEIRQPGEPPPVQAPSAKDIAEEYLQWLQAHEPLVGNWVKQDLVRATYIPFCDALGWPERPYKDFLRELATLTRRRRKDVTVCGCRTTWTEYEVPSDYTTLAEFDEKSGQGSKR